MGAAESGLLPGERVQRAQHLALNLTNVQEFEGMALSDLAVRQAKATGKAYTRADTDGLSLFVAPRAARLGTFATTGSANRSACPWGPTQR